MSQLKLQRVRNFEKYLQICKLNNLYTIKDVLSKPESDLMYILDLSLDEVKEMRLLVSDKCCPQLTTSYDLLLQNEKQKREKGRYLPTKLNDLDTSLGGGVPFGSLTEVVGQAGIGKTQLCLMLSLFATFPPHLGGMDGSVLYFDTEFSFSSERLLEIAHQQLGEQNISCLEKSIQSIIVYTPNSPEDLLLKLQSLEEIIIEKNVKFIVIDSIAFAQRRNNYIYNNTKTSSESSHHFKQPSNNLLGKISAILKYLAESFQIPVLLTNQVTSSRSTPQHSFLSPSDSPEHSNVKAALGTSWGHYVNTRLIMHAFSSVHRLITIAKSPLSPVISFPYNINDSGIIRTEEREIRYPGNYWDFPIESRFNPSSSLGAQHHVTLLHQTSKK